MKKMKRLLQGETHSFTHTSESKRKIEITWMCVEKHKSHVQSDV